MGRLAIGDVVPCDPRLVPLGAAIPPVWLALTVPPRKDFAAVEFLKARGLQAFAPSVTRVRHRRGVRSEVVSPVVPGMVFARFDRAPHWAALRARRIVSGVLSLGGVPVVLRTAELMRVRGLPEAMAAMVSRAATVTVGERIRLAEGPLAGYLVEVVAVRGAQALCEAMGVKLTVPVADLTDAR